MDDQKIVPHRSVISSARQWATVLVTIGAWLLISNHCVLGLDATAEKSDSKSEGCPMHSAPAKEKPAANSPCCKDLRAIAPQLLKNFTAVASELAGVRDYLATIFLAPPRLNIEPFALDTGPPPSLSFAESILQRSILAHAPPTGFTLS